MMSLLLLAAAAPDPSPERQRVTTNAITHLDNYLDAIGFSDACLDRNDMQAVEPLQGRIEDVRRRAATAFPTLARTGTAGDMDFVCQRPSKSPHVSRRAIRRKVAQLVAEAEATLAPTAPASADGGSLPPAQQD